MLELKNISLSVEDEFSNNTQKEILRDRQRGCRRGNRAEAGAQKL